MRLPGPSPLLTPESRGERQLRLIRGHGLFAVVLGSWLLSLAGLWLFSGLLVWIAGLLYIIYDTGLLAYVAWSTRNLRHPPPIAMADSHDSPPPTIGVIVAARNERLILPACIRALQAQTDIPDQILIVDDGSTDDTIAILREQFALTDSSGMLARNGNLGVYRKLHSGKARSLNEALPHIETDVVVTIDADTLLAPGAIAALRSAFANDPKLVAGCGVLRPRCAPGTLSARFFEWFQTFEYLRAFLSREAWARIHSLLLVSGAFAGFRRDALMKVGGFDPLSRVEDYELIHRLHRYSFERTLGWQVAVVSQAYAETDAPSTLPMFLRQRRRWFAGFLETQFANRDMVGSSRYGKVGRVMLPVKVVDTLQPVFGITAFLLLSYFIVTLQPVLPFVLLTIGIKLGIDVIYHAWSVHVYHRWLGRRVTGNTWLLAIAAAFAEPFSFQLMRHLGAVLGWFTFLRGRNDWVPILESPNETTEMQDLP